MYTLHTRSCTFGADLHAQSVLFNKISASELSRKLIKSTVRTLLVGEAHQGDGLLKNISLKSEICFHLCLCFLKLLSKVAGKEVFTYSYLIGSLIWRFCDSKEESCELDTAVVLSKVMVHTVLQKRLPN